MDGRNSTWLSVLVAIVIALAFLGSLSFRILSDHTSDVTLADPVTDREEQGGTLPLNTLLNVDVTPETVQSVIETLERPASYSRTMVLTTYWSSSQGGMDSSDIQVQVWVDGGFTKVVRTLGSGTTQYSISGDGFFYNWDSGDSRWYEGEEDIYSSDLAQRLPTYEDVLNVEPSNIVQAYFCEKNGENCIFVGIENPELGQMQAYWISISSGLLWAAEIWHDDTLVYAAASGAVTVPVSPDAEFKLPNGTVLHALS